MFLHSLLNVLVQIANKMRFQKKVCSGKPLKPPVTTVGNTANISIPFQTPKRDKEWLEKITL
jgi:hypothetical protein